MFHYIGNSRLFKHAATAPSVGSCLSNDRGVTQSVSSTEFGYSLQVGLCQFLNGDLHLDYEVLRWSKLAKGFGVLKVRQTITAK